MMWRFSLHNIYVTINVVQELYIINDIAERIKEHETYIVGTKRETYKHLCHLENDNPNHYLYSFVINRLMFTSSTSNETVFNYF